MATIETWAVDLAEVGPLYPFVGTEFVLFLVGMAFWIVWHIWQIKFEKETYDEDLAKLDTKEKLAKAMQEHRID